MLDGIAKSPADVTMETDFKYASTEIAAALKGKSDHAISESTLLYMGCLYQIPSFKP